MFRTCELVWHGGVWLTVVTSVAIVGMAACQGGRTAGDRLEGLRAALPDSIDGWTCEDEDAIYDAESIYSYIDGHAEVYLAYGMRRCLARSYRGPAGESGITVDVFEMPTTADAFGVFTHDRDGDPVEIGADGLFRYGWLSFWQGSFFVSVYAEEDTEEEHGPDDAPEDRRPGFAAASALRGTLRAAGLLGAVAPPLCLSGASVLCFAAGAHAVPFPALRRPLRARVTPTRRTLAAPSLTPGGSLPRHRQEDVGEHTGSSLPRR